MNKLIGHPAPHFLQGESQSCREGIVGIPGTFLSLALNGSDAGGDAGS